MGSIARSMPRVVLAVAALGAPVVTGCADDGVAAPDLSGAALEVVAVWQGAEAESFEAVLTRFEERTGADVTYTSAGGEDLAELLDGRLRSGDPPDVAIVPQLGLLQRYAERGVIEPIDDVVGDEIRSAWAPIWQQLGTVDGRLYGMWFKAANKSLVWYSLAAFEEFGIVAPEDLDGLLGAARTLASGGRPAFSLTGVASDAWTLTDWFENLYLRQAGPDRYDALADHRLPWTDPTVARTLRTMATLLDPALVTRVDGAETTFPDSVEAVFAVDPRAAMVVEGDFVPGVVAPGPAELGVDVGVFDFPGVRPQDRSVVGAGDAVVAMERSPAADALLSYLASTDAAITWAGRGGFLSPNDDVPLDAYPDPVTRRIARSLLDAGDGFRFDLSDRQPAEFGGTPGAGMWAALEAFVTGGADLATTLDELESSAAAAWAGS